MVKTKPIFETPEESDGNRYAICATLPRHPKESPILAWKIDKWIKTLAPDYPLFLAWKKKWITWEEYTSRYIDLMNNQSEIITELAKEAMEGNITLLCWEKEDNPHCHRHILKQLIEITMQHMELCHANDSEQ